ncbi:MAG TPA: ABC transporter ATP-binding protein [Dehalococcoidia bacterium]|nr:ABC transporter ATP-binding protein [Dehalococcoidia bacterium]
MRSAVAPGPSPAGSGDRPGPGIQGVGVYKSYGPLPVLRSTDLEVGWGERTLLLGPNGSGKSTILKILATLVRPTAGRALVAGLDVVAEGAAVRPLIGVVCHQTFLYGDLTVQENLEFYGRMYRVPDLSGRLRETIDRWGLKAWARRRVRELSRGMQQRVALARALLHRPSVLLLDEPDTGLDEVAFAVLKGALEEAAAQGCAVLFTSHNLLRGLSLADRVSILVAGRIAFEARRDGLDPGELEGTYRRLAAAP